MFVINFKADKPPVIKLKQYKFLFKIQTKYDSDEKKFQSSLDN